MKAIDKLNKLLNDPERLKIFTDEHVTEIKQKEDSAIEFLRSEQFESDYQDLVKYLRTSGFAAFDPYSDFEFQDKFDNIIRTLQRANVLDEQYVKSDCLFPLSESFYRDLRIETMYGQGASTIVYLKD